MKCPMCGLINPETARRCDCGYDFASGRVGRSYVRQSERETAQTVYYWYLKVLQNYAVFSGRASLNEYWYFVLFNIIIMIGIPIIGLITGTLWAGTLLGGIYTLALLIPSIAVSVRRLHDTDRSGWWFLFGLIPLIGTIVFLVFMLQDGKPGANQYGANPKEIAT